MNETDIKANTAQELPETVVETRTGFSIVWLIPLVAALIAIWLAYKAWSESGPTVTISFKTAEGLEAGQTKIKYKNVEIGVIEKIALSEDLSRVIVTAIMVKDAENFLRENTRFWVVRARVAAGEVSALGTLLSGAYIGIDPGKVGRTAKRFSGLETPPVVTTDIPGARFMLLSEDLGSIDIGSPVYYRKIKVGQVVSHQLNADGQSVTMGIFINAPHHQRVNQYTRFWNASGLDVTVGADGIKVNTESLITLILGGIAFDTPAGTTALPPAPQGHEFPLYRDRTATSEVEYAFKDYYILYFSQSVRGLSVGAPVEFKGIRIGKVTNIRMEFDSQLKEAKIPVMIALEPARFGIAGGANPLSLPAAQKKEVLDRFVGNGLRAQLKTGNYVTGQLYIDMEINPKAPPAEIVWKTTPPEFPTMPTPLAEITNSVAHILNKLESLPLESLGKQILQSIESLSKTMQETERLTQNLNDNISPAVTATLDQLRNTLAAAENTLSQDSPMQLEINELLKELSKAARSIRLMTDYLERHPDALIYGKKEKE